MRQSEPSSRGTPFRPTPVPLEARRICFSIPGEMTDGFLSQIAMFRLALRALPAPIGGARIIAYLGCPPGSTVPLRWQPYLHDVEFRLFHEPAPDNQLIQATQRFCQDDPALDYVILCDADTLILGDITQALVQLAHGFAAAGVIAHAPPCSEKDWIALSTAITGTPIALPYHYTIWTTSSGPTHRAPFYVNHGFLAFRADALRDFAAPYLEMRKTVASRVERPFFTGQIALALTLHALGWQGAALPMRYNFPNDPRAFDLHNREAQDIRVLHYLREHHFQRASLFADATAFHAFADTLPAPADQPLHDAILRLTGGQYPFS